MNKYLLIFFSLFFIKQGFNQTVFNNVYNDYADTTYLEYYNREYFNDILTTKSNTVIAIGASNRVDSAYIYVYIVEIGTGGDTIKNKRISLDTFSYNGGGDLIQMNDSTFYLFGFTSGNQYLPSQLPNGLMMKLDKNLKYLWHKVYNFGARHRMNRALYNEVDNVFYTLSYAYSDTTNQEFDVFLSKIDTAGNLLDNWQYGGFDTEFCYDFKQLDNGTFIMSGLTYTNATGTLGRPDIYILNVDTFGNVLWEKKYGYPGYDYTQGRQNLYIGEDYIYVAALHELMSGDNVAWLLKLDMQGDTIWSKKYFEDSEYNDFNGIEKWDDNSFIVFGSTRDIAVSTNKSSCWLLKLDTIGNVIWKRIISKNPADVNSYTYTFDFEIAPDKGILLAGYVINNDFQENGIFHRNDAWLAKTDSCGFTVGDIPEPILLIDSIIGNTIYITDQSQNYCTAELDWGDGSENTVYYAYENNLPLAQKQFSHTYATLDNYNSTCRRRVSGV